MRALITIFLVFISILTFGQTKIDTVVFNKVNEYRVSKNIEPLKWDTTCFKAAEIHTKYLIKTGKVGHTEDSLKDPEDRIRVFNKKTRFKTICEVAVSTKPINIKDTDVDIIEKLATAVVNGWKESDSHNKILLNKGVTCRFAGVSSLIISIPSGFRGVKNYRVLSTMVLIDK